MSKWIEFRGPFTSKSALTKIWDVYPKDGGKRIGQVKWYGSWRKYAFMPEPFCVFEQDCLRDIASFIELKTRDHKQKPEPAWNHTTSK